jgi:hypothetical protein
VEYFRTEVVFDEHRAIERKQVKSGSEFLVLARKYQRTNEFWTYLNLRDRGTTKCSYLLSSLINDLRIKKKMWAGNRELRIPSIIIGHNHYI